MGKFFLIISVFLSFVLVCKAEGEIFVSYKGLDKVHLEFDYATNIAGIVEVKVPETGESLFSQTTPGGWTNISKIIVHTGLSQGTYTYQLWFNDSLKSSVAVEINGKIKGELLDDETINETAILEDNIIVPTGKNFTVNGSIVGENLLKNNVYVKGTINFQNEIALKEVNIHFQGGSSSINEIEGNGTLIFYSSSSGSSVEKCKGQLGILIKNNTSVSISNSEIGWFGMEEKETSLDISDSVILGIVNLTKIQGFKADGDIFMGQVTITGGSPKFEKCEFAYYVLLCNRNEGEFKECVFGTSLEFYDNGEITDVPKWVENSDIQPTFSGNSFVGRMGPVFTDNLTLSTPVNLGNNYYGDKKPLLADDTYYLGSGVQPGWFLTRGVPINKYHFKIEQWSKSGPEMKNQKKLPSIWLNDYIIGQNCISHLSGALGTKKDPFLIQGRETLLSLDVATNYTNVSGVKFKAIFDGQEIEPVNSDVVLHRDISKLGISVFYGNTTVNFILPPTDKDTVNLSVEMDTRGISGFDDAPGKEETEILNRTLKFAPVYGRQLNVVVQPVQLYITGYTRSAPDGKGVENALKKLIPAMLPISKENLNIWTAPPTTFYGGFLSMVSSTALLNRIASELSLSQGFINTTAKVGEWVTGQETARIDFVVAVLPKGVMGKETSGASLKLRRGVIFVDESKPDAALHEMGHGIGLYTWQEQYKQYPPAGLQVEGLTAFINDESAANSIDGFWKNRFLHFPRKEQSWYQEKFWYDIMGCAKYTWPIETTFLEFISYFRSALGSKTKSTVYKEAGVPEGYRRIFVSGKTEKVESAVYYYQFIPGTISSFDITEIATGKISVPAEISYCPADDYKLECYDSSGNIIQSATQYFTTVSPYKNYDNVSDWPEESTFCGTFDIPESTETLKIFHRLWWDVWEENPIFVLTSSSSPKISITSPSSGTLSDSVNISWTTTKQAGGAMQYVVMVSPDEGETWFPIGVPTTSTSLTIPTDFLPASDKITFKVVGSNGLGSNSAKVSNLTIKNRKPKAIIVSPEDGWVGNTDTKWMLKGYGSDIEDGTIPTGVWTIDGKKVEGTEVVLNSGIYTIKFKVTDSGGLTDETSVVVEVKEAIEEVDLSLNEESLTLFTPKSDPLNTSPIIWLEKDGVHGAILKIQNVGIETNFTASLYLKGPSDTTGKLLASKPFSPDAFEEVVLSETFIVSAEGEYQIKGEITKITPTDTNDSNNTKTWTYRTQPEEPIIEVIPEELDFGEVKEITKGLIIIKNDGKTDLKITSLEITGDNASEFSITSSVPDIPADNLVLLPIYFNPTSKGDKAAKLEITSNDTEKPKITIPLKGTCVEVPIASGDINESGKVDISDVILCLRMAIKLDPVNASKADINGDGKVDISDVILILRKAIGL